MPPASPAAPSGSRMGPANKKRRGNNPAAVEIYAATLLGLTRRSAGIVDDWPPALFILFNERCEDVELIALLGARRSTPKPFDFSQGSGVILVVRDRTNCHAASIAKNGGEITPAAVISSA